jgi:hypothetical protein
MTKQELLKKADNILSDKNYKNLHPIFEIYEININAFREILGVHFIDSLSDLKGYFLSPYISIQGIYREYKEESIRDTIKDSNLTHIRIANSYSFVTDNGNIFTIGEDYSIEKYFHKEGDRHVSLFELLLNIFIENKLKTLGDELDKVFSRFEILDID